MNSTNSFNEADTVELPIIDFLADELGYEYLEKSQLSQLRGSEKDYIIEPILKSALHTINPDAGEEEIENVIREIKKIDANEEFLNTLRDGVNLKNPQTGKFAYYKVLDFDSPSGNRFNVANQFYFEGENGNINLDILIFVNGLPLVNIELKSPTSSNVDHKDAIHQIHRYQETAPKLYIPNCFNIASNLITTKYGATGASERHFFEWKGETTETDKETEPDKEEAEKGMDKQPWVALHALLEHSNLMDIIQNFILFEKKDGTSTKKIARYQQIRATNKIVQQVVSGENNEGLIWHTQGSGKTLTMFFTAWKLRFHKELNNPRVFVLVDRVDLDDQMFETFSNSGGKNVIRVISREDLEAKIQSQEKGIFITTIQKFSEFEEAVKNLDKNVIVLSDEAHRGDEGISGVNMRSAFRNAFFFGFTGTPIAKKDRNTFLNYGGEEGKYLDYYSMQQAIDDGATVPVVYQPRPSEFFIDEVSLEREFEDIVEGLTDKEKTEVIKRQATKESLIKHEDRIEAIAKDIVNHFKKYVEPNGFKAQIVASDREAVAAYKKELDELIPKECSEVVYSPGDPNTDPDELKEYNTTKSERVEIIKRFKDPDSSLHFLIVCDMLLTGFDAPIEQVMYLDKSLRDHNLLQAIARTNRVYPNKPAGIIVDYHGVTRNLEEALDFNKDIIDSALISIEEVKERFVDTLEKAMEFFDKIDLENGSPKELERHLKVFIEEEKQKEFSRTYQNLKNLFELLSPDPFLKKYLKQFQWITKIHIAFLKQFKQKDDAHLLDEYGEKVKTLIKESPAINYEGIKQDFPELKLSDILAQGKLEGMDPGIKAFTLESMLKQEISADVDGNPKYQGFAERLAAIQRDFVQNQIDLEKRIRELEKLWHDIWEEKKQPEKLGVTPGEYALFVVSKEWLPDSSEEVLLKFVKDIGNRIENDLVLDEEWQNLSKREEHIKEIKKILDEMILRDYKDELKTKDLSMLRNRLVGVIESKF